MSSDKVVRSVSRHVCHHQVDLGVKKLKRGDERRQPCPITLNVMNSGQSLLYTHMNLQDIAYIAFIGNKNLNDTPLIAKH
ncbi:hypothetical protein T265_09877 [Opisthorchis viverrini]|uniref:Uncharacterized protein n=1 Tax=Opisthorchis viverrini TaxID=6198 RepID=A0A074ZF84_OPIVI|nr:hypothetical protein T265_09877 [Opisthorchis viverrini]KER21895.1 hypothetical protein T265_09877 [Opisthorchis viverrini]